jgi:hypothetical protein
MILAWLIGLLLPAQVRGAASARERLWKEVDDALQQGLPRTALTNLDRLIPLTVEARSWGEAAKAIARKAMIEGTLESPQADERIRRLEQALDQAPNETLPVLKTILAHWYWHYFRANRWRFMQRTATAVTPGEDFTTWDLARLFSRIDQVFTDALAFAEPLQRTPVKSFSAVLTPETMLDRYRPTLYDILAHEALRFYTAGEQAVAKTEEAFQVDASSPMLGSAAGFQAWWPTLPSGQAAAPEVKAIRLYGQLMAYHAQDEDPSAFVDLDLARLVYGANVTVGDAKPQRYRAALREFVDRWGDHEVSAQALFHWATSLRAEDDLAAAHALARRGYEVFPNSVGGKQCQNLLAEIEAKFAQVATERVWNPSDSGRGGSPSEKPAVEGSAAGKGRPLIEVRYRNVTQIWLRAVAWDWHDFLRRDRPRPEAFGAREIKELLERPSAWSWSTELAPTTDFKARTAWLPAPADLPPGHYFLVASHDRDFGKQDNVVSCAPFWVSDLALIVRPRNGQIEGFVLDARSGEPLAGAEVVAWSLDRSGERVAEPALKTDEQGFYQFPTNTLRGYLLRARHRGQEVATETEHAARRWRRTERWDQTVFFTDRAIYRPGQLIHYKGIALRIDAERDDYAPLAGRVLEVALIDPNGKEVAAARHQCNDYGSFHGSFTAPRDRLLGGYRLQIKEGGSGSTGISIEEYKRPKFQVALEAPPEAARLMEKVKLLGEATGYSGAAVDGAEVRWRVVRNARWPEWARRTTIWPPGGWRPAEAQPIAHGQTRTGTDGRFALEFIAHPDPQVAPEDQVVFTYQVHAEVTDGAGETRFAELSVRLGYVSLQATVEADEWQTRNRPVELRLRCRTLDDQPQAARGQLRVSRLKSPAGVPRPRLGAEPWNDLDERGLPATDQADPERWALGEIVAEQPFVAGADGQATLRFPLGAGAYRAVLETADAQGTQVIAQRTLVVLDPDADAFALPLPQWLSAPQWSVEPGEEFAALWGTGYAEGRAFIEIEHRQRLIQRFWTTPGRTQMMVRQAATEALRGGFTLHVTQVRENRAHLVSRRVDVPWSDRQLEVRWERFVSKLEPGQKETWTAVITRRAAGGGTGTSGGDSRGSVEAAVAEMVATLYDASLDQFAGLNWPNQFDFFYQDYSTAQPHYVNTWKGLRHLHGSWADRYVPVEAAYRQLLPDLLGGHDVQTLLMARSAKVGGPMLAPAPTASFGAQVADMAAAPGAAPSPEAAGLNQSGGGAPAEQGTRSATPSDLAQVSARRNLSETAFFFPQLTSDTNGEVRLTFTMPEALTTWRFLGFAHDRRLRSGVLEDEAITAKELMVQPNPPRFMREGDLIEFVVKISNQSASRQAGQVQLNFSDARTGANVDRELSHAQPEQAFDIPAQESRTYAWRLRVPDGAPYLTYRAVASTGQRSDGEEGYVPLLPRRVLVTESLPLPIRVKAGAGPVTQQYRFEGLLRSGASRTLAHQRVVLQMVSQPAWYAVLALPYLMEYPHECVEQTFNRLYANALARFLAQSDDRIRRVFDQWQTTPALDSPLEKNEDLKSVMLEETPWLRQANDESQARRRIGLLFEQNRLDHELGLIAQKLQEAQLGDGGWPWFPGGSADDYITLYVTTGYGRLRHLGVEDLDVGLALRALDRLDAWITRRHAQVLEQKRPQEHVPTSTEALYLYGRSFFLKDRPLADAAANAAGFMLEQARLHWVKVGSRQSQGHLALALKRWGREGGLNAARAILQSLKERSVSDGELGRHWRDAEPTWWWHGAPIETQALMIEAFDEVTGDQDAVEDCRVWLLKQKQTQDWKTTKATADAVYALLLRGRNLLGSDALVEVSLGGVQVTPSSVGGALSSGRREGVSAQTEIEPGTGFFERRWVGSEILPKLGEITLTKRDEGVAWGGLHWQYLEDLSQVKSHTATPLRLRKTLYTRANSAAGLQLQPLVASVSVGDEVVVRLELQVDRDMEYVHLKDQRGSGTEPVNVLSGHRYRDGLAYYETTRDTASHFFIAYLPKGTYVFEYPVRVQHRGEYQSGIASIQCLYAPEFSSHSASVGLKTR